MINLFEYDKTITESEFKSKVSTMFMMLYISIMTDNLKRVSHLINQSVFKKYEVFLNELNLRNERQMYDLLTVESTEIKEVNIDNNTLSVTVKLTTKYMDYVVNKSSKQIVRGNNNDRIEKINYLTLEKNCNKKNTTCCSDIYFCKECDWIITNIDENLQFIHN